MLLEVVGRFVIEIDLLAFRTNLTCTAPSVWLSQKNTTLTRTICRQVAFGAVDCTVNRNVCDTFDVKGYPSFYYMSYGKNEVKYQGGREVGWSAVV